MVKQILKVMVSGIIALIILSMLSMVYYNPPLGLPQPDKITNYRHMENVRWSAMLEGAGYGKIDQLGYNNMYYNNCTDPDIVFVGSSNLEAFQVPADSNFVHLLNQKLAEDDAASNDFACMNIGISGHFFNIVASNFRNVVEKYKDAKYFIIETGNVRFGADEIEKMLTEKDSNPYEGSGKLSMAVRGVPFVKLLLKKVAELNEGNTDNQKQTPSAEDMELYKEKMSEVLDKIAKLSAEKNAKTMILFHSRFQVIGDEIQIEHDAEYLKAFRECCEENGVEFIDVTPRFISEYQNTYKLPYGFSNTTPGAGHLNKWGHKLIAEELYHIFAEGEE